jgi:hypothetical protein
MVRNMPVTICMTSTIDANTPKMYHQLKFFEA